MSIKQRIKNLLKKYLPLSARKQREIEKNLVNQIAGIREVINSMTQSYIKNTDSPQIYQMPEWERKIREILEKENLIVQSGPFRGMRYPSFTATGSSLYPKLIGSYEREIHNFIQKILVKKYDFIFDVGCAEGYYAIGLAYKLKNIGRSTKIMAFDTNKEAQRMCRDMCETNDVEDIVEIQAWCTPKYLESFDFGKKSLIIADCEGFERELFNKKNAQNLKNVDMLVEIHDWCQDEIMTLDYLKDLFEGTHKIELIYGIDDYEKAYTYNYPETATFPISERFLIFQEGRRRLGEWLFLEAIQSREH